MNWVYRHIKSSGCVLRYDADNPNTTNEVLQLDGTWRKMPAAFDLKQDTDATIARYE